AALQVVAVVGDGRLQVGGRPDHRVHRLAVGRLHAGAHGGAGRDGARHALVLRHRRAACVPRRRGRHQLVAAVAQDRRVATDHVPISYSSPGSASGPVHTSARPGLSMVISSLYAVGPGDGATWTHTSTWVGAVVSGCSSWTIASLTSGRSPRS